MSGLNLSGSPTQVVVIIVIIACALILILAFGSGSTGPSVESENGTDLRKVKFPNPVNPEAPIPGSDLFQTPEFADLRDYKISTPGTRATKELLLRTFDGFEAAKNAFLNFTAYERAVLLNTVACIQDRSDSLLGDATFVGFYGAHPGNDRQPAKLPIGIILDGVTSKQLKAASMSDFGMLGLHGRRSPKEDHIGSLEATKLSGQRFAFDVDLYNPKANLKGHMDELIFNRTRLVTTHPADVSRALAGRGVSSGVITEN